MTVFKKVLASILGVLHLNTPARIVVALSPAFVSAAGLLATEAGRLGIHDLTTTDLVGLFVTGATLASTKVLLWLRGAQKSEVLRQSVAGYVGAGIMSCDVAYASAMSKFVPVQVGRSAAEAMEQISSPEFHDIGS